MPVSSCPVWYDTGIPLKSKQKYQVSSNALRNTKPAGCSVTTGYRILTFSGIHSRRVALDILVLISCTALGESSIAGSYTSPQSHTAQSSCKLPSCSTSRTRCVGSSHRTSSVLTSSTRPFSGRPRYRRWSRNRGDDRRGICIERCQGTLLVTRKAFRFDF